MQKRCLVVGGGFKGMIAAYLLKQQSVDVTLLEKAGSLGGIMNSREWNGFYMDNGVQIFDSVPKNLGNIVREVLDDKVVSIDFNYASVYNGRTTNGLAIPDLSHLEQNTKAKILLELLETLTVEYPEPVSMNDYLQVRYGSTAASLLGETMEHIYSISSDQVDVMATNQTLYHRLRFLSDDVTLELKKHPELDTRLAAKRKAVGKVDDFVSLYPEGTAMKGFCVAMEKRLREMGVTIQTGTHIENLDVNSSTAICAMSNGEMSKFDHVVWTNDYHQLSGVWKNESLEHLIHNVPMVVYYFAIDPEICNDYTYFHKFTPGDLVFRPSAAGIYGKQINDQGKTFISVECPGGPNSAIWREPDKHAPMVWKECIEMGLLNESPMSADYMYVQAPVTHRFPKVGFTEARKKLDTAIDETCGTLIMPDCTAFVRRQLMWAVEESVEKIMAA